MDRNLQVGREADINIYTKVPTKVRGNTNVTKSVSGLPVPAVAKSVMPRSKLDDWRWWMLVVLPIFVLLGLFLRMPWLITKVTVCPIKSWLNVSVYSYPVCWGLWVLASPFLFWFFCRRPIEGKSLIRTVVIHVLVGLGFVGVHIFLHALVDELLPHTPLMAPLPQRFKAGLENTGSVELLIFLTLDGFFHSVRSAIRAQATAARERELLHQKTAAELEALRRRLEPHFLFNALNSLCATLSEGSRSRQMATQLSQYLHLVLDRAGSERIPLREELRLADSYLEIESLRHGQRLATRFSVSADALKAMTPALVLQPLVENAIRYATASPAARVEVEVEARVDGQDLVLCVRNSFCPATTGLAGGGRGQAIVRERLNANYGDRARMEISGSTDVYVVSVFLPVEPVT